MNRRVLALLKYMYLPVSEGLTTYKVLSVSNIPGESAGKLILQRFVKKTHEIT